MSFKTVQRALVPAVVVAALSAGPVAAANIADAHLFRQWLEDAGIHAFVLGEYLREKVSDMLFKA